LLILYAVREKKAIEKYYAFVSSVRWHFSLFLLMSDYSSYFLTIFPALPPFCFPAYEQNADIKAFLDAVLIVSSSGMCILMLSAQGESVK